MPAPEYYRVTRQRYHGGESTIITYLSAAEAAEIAFRLARLQEIELGGEDTFLAEPQS